MAADFPGRLRFALIVIAAWTLVALSWTPPTILIQTAFGPTPAASLTGLQVFFSVLASFVPWMAATPLILSLGRRHPVSQGRVAKALAIHLLAGFVIVPAATTLGVLLGRIAIDAYEIKRALSTNVPGAVLITSFYSVPTYIAVVAVGQALGYFERYRARERMLARAELRALEAQLNPHFLFNTLNAISALGYRDARLADEALTGLAAMLRTSLKERPERIALKDEIAFARDYVHLHSLLMPGHARFDIAVASDAWNAAVPAMLPGTDAPNPATAHGVTLHQELQILVQAGYTPEEALHAATALPTEIFHLGDRGHVAAGSRADLLLVDGDPTVTISDTLCIARIWKNGYAVDRTAPKEDANPMLQH